MADVSGNVLCDQLLQLITDSIQRKPCSGAEAAALVAYIVEKDLKPLLQALKAWGVAELSAEESALAALAWSEVKTVETAIATRWCVPR